jgi:phosphoribosylformylglycinamidine synthase
MFSSAISITRGGLGIAIAKSAMSGLLGVNISLKRLAGESYREDFASFSETQGRILVSINPKYKKDFESAFINNSISLIGTVSDSKEFIIRGFKDQVVLNTTVGSLLKSYKSRFAGY